MLQKNIYYSILLKSIAQRNCGLNLNLALNDEALDFPQHKEVDQNEQLCLKVCLEKAVDLICPYSTSQEEVFSRQHHKSRNCIFAPSFIHSFICRCHKGMTLVKSAVQKHIALYLSRVIEEREVQIWIFSI